MDILRESQRTLKRLLANIDLNGLPKAEQRPFIARLESEFPALFTHLYDVYGHHYDFYFHLQELLQTLLTSRSERSPRLRKKDKQRLNSPFWYQHQNMVGMAVYVDLFAGDLQRLQQRIPYLKELGITYLHLMPLYAVPEGDSDGGYAVADYRQVNPSLGSMQDLRKLAEALEKAGINLVLDFVFNHTSDQHPWAEAAKQGDAEYGDYYYLFDDKRIPDQYEQNLREIFPQVRRGSFTFCPQLQKWVWTTFNSFQWDLNYSNPAVFNAIAAEMLFLANVGCDALRLDALAFIWKQMGTDCENQPKAHTLIKAFNQCLQIVAPAVVFKSEAIVHPDEVNKYIHPDECQLSYNPLLMALIWNSLATRKTRLLTESMQKSFTIDPQCTWVNYVRCHDDIGWTFDDAIAWQLGINPHDHRHFLNQFFTGRFEGSFATGVAFAENPATGDCRVCGSMASLCGLEQALEHNDAALIEHAVGRALMIHAILMAIGGIPLLYSGDELGLLNDYDYQQDPHKAHDDRWVQRIPVTEATIQAAQVADSPQFRIAQGLRQMIKIRTANPVFGQGSTRILASGNDHVFTYVRENEQGDCLLAVHNFSEFPQPLALPLMTMLGKSQGSDLLSGQTVNRSQGEVILQPYQSLWLVLQ